MCESFGLGEVGSWSPNGLSSQFAGFPRDTFPWGTDCTASRGGLGRVESKVRVFPLEMVASDDRFLEMGSTGRPISLGFAWNNLLGNPGPPVGQTTSCKPPRGESWVPLVASGCLGELIAGHQALTRITFVSCFTSHLSQHFGAGGPVDTFDWDLVSRGSKTPRVPRSRKIPGVYQHQL